MADGDEQRISLDDLIEIVASGGAIRTGVDIFNKQGRLILEKDVLVTDKKTLLNVKRFGVEDIPIVASRDGGMWDKDGNPIGGAPDPSPPPSPPAAIGAPGSELARKVGEINEVKAAAAEKYQQAKGCIKKVLADIHAKGGNFEFEPIVDTVSDLFDFVSDNESAFSYLTKEIFSYDDYLYNHSINVCAIGTVVARKFNDSFSGLVNNALNTAMGGHPGSEDIPEARFRYFLEDEIRDISIGYFMHDLGKVLVDKKILNKPGKLTDEEFEVIKSHSTSKGLELLEKNRLLNPYIRNISLYHHAALYENEDRCYPDVRTPLEIPAYVKICKLADIYDAMTSKRCYKDAINPVAVVTQIFHRYAGKDRLLQYILHSFVKSVGIYPPGSVVLLTDGRMAYILDSDGPSVIPITDTSGEPLKKEPDLLVLNDPAVKESGLCVDRRNPPLAPVEAYKLLPDFLKKTLS